MALTKVTRGTLLSIVSVASNTATYGSAVDVSTYYAIDIAIKMGRGTGTAFTTSPIARVQVAYESGAAVSSDWITVAEFQPAVGASIASQAVSGTEAAGQTVVTLAAGTNFAAGDFVFFHNTSIGNSEWSRVLSVSSADLTLEEAIVNAQTSSTCRDQAEEYHLLLDCLCVQDVRLIIDSWGSGQASIWAAWFGGVSGL